MTLWGGRFSTKLNEQAWDLNSSLPVDQRMAIQDVDGSIAWADALHNANILSDEEHASISLGLATVKKEFASGQFSFAPSDEDIHTAVERRLTELIGRDSWQTPHGTQPQRPGCHRFQIVDVASDSSFGCCIERFAICIG